MTLATITRDTFNPRPILDAMRKNEPIPDPLRLLEEACHAFHNLNHQHQKLIMRIEAATAGARNV